MEDCTCSWGALSATFGARRRFLLEGSMAKAEARNRRRRVIGMRRQVGGSTEYENGITAMIDAILSVVEMKEQKRIYKALLSTRQPYPTYASGRQPAS